MSRRWTCRSAALLATFAVLLAAPTFARAQPPVADAKAAAVPGQFLTVTSPIDDTVFSRVQTEALKLQKRAAEQNTTGVLILQIDPGTSQFHQVQGLTKFLTSSRIPDVTTVAWVPQTVVGSNALVALACKHVVLHPDAELGDVGRGRALDPEDLQAALALGAKRQNALVNTAVLSALSDVQSTLWRVRLQDGAGPETRFVSGGELDDLRKAGSVIEDAEQLKTAGVPFTVRGAIARSMGLVVSQTAESRAEVGQQFGLARDALREPASQTAASKARLIRVTGTVDPLMEAFLERQIERAVAAGAELIVFEIDSPGGLAVTSMDLANTIVELDSSKVRTVAYVPETAISGAAMIAMACDEIYMRPNARLGDVAPIELKEGGQFARVPEKLMSPIRSALVTLAKRKQRPEALAAVMVDRTVTVFQVTNRDTGRVWYMSADEIAASGGEWIQGPQLAETNGELVLTVSGDRAHELKLAEAPVNDLDDLKQRLGLPALQQLAAVERNWVDDLVFMLNTPAMTIMLLMVGIGALYLEAHFLTGLFTVVSIVSFSLFFWSHWLGGTAGWLEVILFLLGTSFLLLEIFVIPGFGVFGISGILMVLASLVMAIQSFSSYDMWGNVMSLVSGFATIAIALMGLSVLASLMFMLQFRAFRERAPLLAVSTGGFGGQGVLSLEGLVGQTGRTISMLRPAGKARVGEHVVDVISDGQFIPVGEAIEVVEVSGNRVLVRQL